MIHTNQPAWLLYALDCLGNLPESLQQKMARRIVWSAEIDDMAFPSPYVFLDSCGIHLNWKAIEGQPNGPATLSILVSRGESFQGVIWRPGQASEISVVTTDYAEGSRRLFCKFWPTSNTWGLSDMLEFLEVRQ